MLDPHWVFVSAVLGLSGSVRYAFSTMRGTARPNVVTWSLWAAAPLIGFFAQLDGAFAAYVLALCAVLVSIVSARRRAPPHARAVSRA
ncbi:hypothetical protein DTL70_28210 [Streptomyces diacarni]|uniref:Uncharacterized protein n=1 Tax=Streptomyces diacarni TaxID=2800381 RepID=A0A367EFT0_9ACTN|nr:hypothetical protein [Streptomyces diacarni]RCG16813.1 hypothetical protein DTL70_28210 [Streptomyces diacarni]